MVTNKIAESISARSTIGDLRRKCDKHEEDVEKWKRKTQMLQKMCSDLNTVMKRYILDVQNKQDNPTPIKITRSVGLQVCDYKRAWILLKWFREISMWINFTNFSIK